MYRSLDAEKILATCQRLEARIEERFPSSGLTHVAAELTTIADEARRRAAGFLRPNFALRAATLIVVSTIVLSILIVSWLKVEWSQAIWQLDVFVATTEALMATVVFLGAAVIFVVSLENRFKRARVLGGINELRALAHIVDMHQLTKDPEPILRHGPRTKHSPKRTMTPFELSRYFDYCSETLSLISKIGAIYVEGCPDTATHGAVDAIETLTTGLSRKIWQKIMILDRFAAEGPDAAENARSDELGPAKEASAECRRDEHGSF